MYIKLYTVTILLHCLCTIFVPCKGNYFLYTFIEPSDGDEKDLYGVTDRTEENCEKKRGGWSLFYHNTVIGIENLCTWSKENSSISYVDVGANINFIPKVIQMDNRNTMTGPIEDGMGHNGKGEDNLWGVGVLLIVVAIAVWAYYCKNCGN